MWYKDASMEHRVRNEISTQFILVFGLIMFFFDRWSQSYIYERVEYKNASYNLTSKKLTLSFKFKIWRVVYLYNLQNDYV